MYTLQSHVGKPAAARLLSRVSASALAKDVAGLDGARARPFHSGPRCSPPGRRLPTRSKPALPAAPSSLRGSTARPPPRALFSSTANRRDDAAPEPRVHALFEPETESWQYVVADPATRDAVVIDPVLNYAPGPGTLRTTSADAILQLIRAEGYAVTLLLETHAHADHVTAAAYLQAQLAKSQAGRRPPIGIGHRIAAVQARFGPRYGVPASAYRDAFDRLFADDETFAVGRLAAAVLPLPGHTPDHVGYKIGPRDVFTGDTVFAPARGTARCDFPGGDAAALFRAVRARLLDAGSSGLPDDARLWMGHDYAADASQAPIASAPVAEHRRANKHVGDGVDEAAFVAAREARDKVLPAPRLLHQSLQMNIRAGRLPPVDGGSRMLRLPLKLADGIQEW